MRLYEPPPLPPYTEQKCIQELDKVLKNSSKVAILLKGIQALNKDALRRGVTCRPCMGTNEESSMGYYDGTYKRVMICCDSIRTREELEDTLVHELTHAFDSLRKGKFKSACHLIACTEIRASALGHCATIKNVEKKDHCIYINAVSSTERHCGRTKAEKVVKEVFNNCVNDETPFR